MKRILTAVMLAIVAGICLQARDVAADDLPRTLFASIKEGHVQGIALDRDKGYMYYSFTSCFIKTDLEGNVIGTIGRIQGHLGAMTLGPDGRVYASLECKDDVIGQGVANRLGVDVVAHERSVFYVAVIDVDKIDRVGMDPEKDGVMTTVCIKDACREYVDKRYGCSGIDGITFAPAIGRKHGRMYLYVAYGIYLDNDREDNDHQIILCYDIRDWKRRYETPVVFGTVPENGPEHPLHKYFVYTGNTDWGVQNMAYDAHTGRIYLAVYKGRKPAFPNYPLFAVDVAQKAFKAPVKGVGEVHEQLRLSEAGLRDETTGVRGWRFRYGSTGLCPVGGGYWYISEPAKDKATGIQSCTARLYRWTGDDTNPFEEVK